jgi:glycosyltransferase involved in cell wall biosynthesis
VSAFGQSVASGAQATRGSGCAPERACIHVLHVLDVLRASGAEVMLETAGPLWAAHGVEPAVLTVAPVLGPFTERVAAAGYEIVRLDADPPMKLLVAFSRLLRRERYDVVHLHMERASFWLAMIARATGARVVQTCHNCFPFDGPLRMERSVQRALGRAAGVTYVAVSPSVQRNERSRFANHAELIWNWYDAGRFRPPSSAERDEARRRLGLAPSQFVVTTVGNCSVAKGHATLLDALARCDDVELVYLHVGDHSSSLGASEIRRTRELGLDARARFLGPVDAVESVLHATDLFVMPSRWEGLGLAALEALACGVRVMVADAPGIRDVAMLDPSAETVEPTPEAFARAITAAVSRGHAPRSRTPTARSPLIEPAEGVARYAKLYGFSPSRPPVRRHRPGHARR